MPSCNVIAAGVLSGLALTVSGAYKKGDLLWKTDFTAAEVAAINRDAQQRLVEGRTWRAADGKTGDGTVYVRHQTAAGDFKLDIPLDPEKFKGLVFVEADVKGVDLERGPQPFNGPKIMVPWDDGGRTRYPQAPSEFGTFDWKTWVMVLNLPPDLKRISLVVGLENAPGEFWIDGVRIWRAVEIPDDEAATAPPNPRADALPRGRFAGKPSPACFRGVMSGGDLSEEAFKTLRDWRANLIRFQIGIGTRDCNDMDEWFRRLDRKLDEMDAALKLCRKYGLKLVVDLHGGPGTKRTKYASNVVPGDYDTTNLRKAWRTIATRFREDPAIYGYDILNEPATSPATWDRVFREVVAEIRTVDAKTPVITETVAFHYPDENVIYSPHYYSPHTLTHMGIGGGPTVRWSYNNWINGEFWNKDRIREALAPFILFQQRHPEARIYVGEFSCILWAKGAAAYINDCIELFDEYGWDWTYHAFREWPPWSVEHEHADDYALGKVHKAAHDTDRKQALLKGLRNNAVREPRPGTD
ncbi:MAG: glycoside hydrolase family 5 protein [Kiritimatiellia bacterium]